jgi:hypothetical protein
VHDDARTVLMAGLREAGFTGRIAVRSHDAEDAAALRARGADLVLAPFADGAVRACELMGFIPQGAPFDTQADGAQP